MSDLLLRARNHVFVANESVSRKPAELAVNVCRPARLDIDVDELFEAHICARQRVLVGRQVFGRLGRIYGFRISRRVDEPAVGIPVKQLLRIGVVHGKLRTFSALAAHSRVRRQDRIKVTLLGEGLFREFLAQHAALEHPFGFRWGSLGLHFSGYPRPSGRT